jgi:predicted transcriptional regulator
MSDPSAKKKVLETLSRLPPNATVEEAMEQLYFLAKIERGVEQAESGRTVSHDEVKHRFIG